MNEATPEEDREMEELQEPVDAPCENNSYKRKPAWVREAILGAKDMVLQKEYTNKWRDLGHTPVM